MSDYKTIHGVKIQGVSSDPPAPFTGQVWYNTTSGDLKVDAGTPVGAWATGGSLNTPRAYSGVLPSGSYVLNTRTGKKERISRIYQMHANKQNQIDELAH